MSAVCTSATVRNIVSNSGRLMNFAKRVCIRYPDPSGASSSDVTASAKFAAHGSKWFTPLSDNMSGARYRSMVYISASVFEIGVPVANTTPRPSRQRGREGF